MQRLELTGKRFGRLVVVSFAGPSPRPRKLGGRPMWDCVCDCGNKIRVQGNKLNSGAIPSCGCTQREAARKLMTTHGLSKTPTYRAWHNMKERCSNPNCISYPNYGARGIKVCAAWNASFEAFLADMGVRPSSAHSLDRIDVNGDYAPENCRWATFRQQCINTRGTIYVDYKGVRTPLPAVYDLSPKHISYDQFRKRVRAGWSLDDAMSIPILSNGTKLKNLQRATP